MIVKHAESESFLRRVPPAVAAVLFYGADQGLVRERAERLALSIVPDLRDPFRMTELDAATLLEYPARLSDEAAALSMSGGRRVVRIRGAGNTVSRIFIDFFSKAFADAMVVVEAGDLAKDSSLREAFAEASNAAVVACYPDTAEGIAELVRGALKSERIAIAPDALEEAVSLLGSDRGTTRREVEKLVLYARGAERVTLEDVRAIMGDEAEARIEEVCDAAGEGDTRRLDVALERLWSAGISPVGVLRVAMGHFQRLALAKNQMAKGESADNIAKRARPPIHFTRLAAFKTQLRNLSEERISDALDLLLETESLCKSTGVPGEAACGRALFTIAAWARLPP